MTMITPSYLGETIEYSSLHACRSTLEDPTQDDNPRALVERAIRAMGGEEQLKKHPAGRYKAKGKIDIMGAQRDFTQDFAFQAPDKFRSQVEMELMDMQFTIVSVFDGQKGAILLNGKKLPLPEGTLETLKEGGTLIQVGRLLPLKEKAYELSALGEAQVHGKPAVGLRAVKKGQPDVNLYFDKKTDLLVKMEYRTRDPLTAQELTEERLLSDYQTKDGVPAPRKVEINRDGKRFLEAEVTETQKLERIDDSEFGSE